MTTKATPATKLPPAVTEALDNYALTLRLQDINTSIARIAPTVSGLAVLVEKVENLTKSLNHEVHDIGVLEQRIAGFEQALLDLEEKRAVPAAAASTVGYVSGPHVYVALSAMVKSFSEVGLAKTRENTHGAKFKFRGIDELMNAASPLLAEHKLLVLPRVLSRTVSERVTSNGGALFDVVLDVEFDFVSAVDGSKHTVRTAGEAFDSGDKATNKAMSAAFKYALLQSWCIPLEGDNDADASTHEVKAATPAGYGAYLGEAELAARQGIDALRAFAKASPKPLWEWLLTKDAAMLEALQVVAKAVVTTDAAA